MLAERGNDSDNVSLLRGSTKSRPGRWYRPRAEGVESGSYPRGPNPDYTVVFVSIGVKGKMFPYVCGPLSDLGFSGDFGVLEGTNKVSL